MVKFPSCRTRGKFYDVAPDWLFVEQPPPFGALDSDLRPLCVGYPPKIPTKRKFVAISVEVLFADVVKRADNAPLEQGKKTFDCVCVCVAARVFASGVPHNFMASRELFAEPVRSEERRVGKECRPGWWP